MMNTEFSETTWRGLSEQEGRCDSVDAVIAELEEIGIDCDFRPLTTIFNLIIDIFHIHLVSSLSPLNFKCCVSFGS